MDMPNELKAINLLGFCLLRLTCQPSELFTIFKSHMEKATITLKKLSNQPDDHDTRGIEKDIGHKSCRLSFIP